MDYHDIDDNFDPMAGPAEEINLIEKFIKYLCRKLLFLRRNYIP